MLDNFLDKMAKKKNRKDPGTELQKSILKKLCWKHSSFREV